MIKKPSIDLTPLLDIVLIILFAVMLNAGNHISNLAEKTRQIANEKQQATHEKEQIQQQLKKVLEQNKALQKQLSDKKEFEFEQKEFYENMLSAFYKTLGADEDETKKILQNIYSDDKAIMEKEIEKLLHKENFIKEYIKYSIITNKVYLLEIALATDKNRIFFNAEPTDFYVLLSETNPKEEEMIHNIADLIDKKIGSREGGVGMILVSLTWLDDGVDKKAYDLVWRAIKELESTYGNTRLFKTQYKYLEMGE